jgi:hypothetical protein
MFKTVCLAFDFSYKSVNSHTEKQASKRVLSCNTPSLFRRQV